MKEAAGAAGGGKAEAYATLGRGDAAAWAGPPALRAGGDGLDAAAPGLLLGYLDRLGQVERDGRMAWDPSPRWLPLCRRAHAMLADEDDSRATA